MRCVEVAAVIRLIFAYNFSMQLAAPEPRRHKVLMSFRYWNAWDVIFFDTDRMRTALPRRARFNSDESVDRVRPARWWDKDVRGPANSRHDDSAQDRRDHS